MATDLLELVCHLKNEWNVDKFHLLGHSLGGAICFEFLKLLKFPPKEIIMGGKKSGDENVNNTSMPECLSFILSNASTNFQLSDSERDRLFEEVKLQQLQTLHPRQMQTAHNNNSIISLPQQQKKDSTPKQQKQQNHHALDVNMQQQFFQMHICRTLTMPSVLQSAFRRRGKDWSAKEYIALPPQMTFKSTASAIHDTCTNNGKSTMSEMKCAGFPPVLIIRGEYDFITETCTRGWRDIFIDEEKDERQHPSSEEDTMASATLSSTKVEYSSNTLKEIVMKDCAHYPHLERPKEFAYEVEDFCSNAEKMISMQHI